MSKDYHELPKLRDSISYIYLEHCQIEQEELSISIIRKNERIPVPISSTTCLLIGPGTNITHAAVKAMSENGCTAIWCGENLRRFYAFGSPETRSAKNILKQAELCMDKEKHSIVAKRMYERRFPDLPEGEYTIQQLRGMEGIRVKQAYKLASKLTGVNWNGRNYKTSEWDASDEINKALSQANALLYNICESAIVSLGFSTALGFIHTGKMLSFVYDIADLYKAETTIPIAFESVKHCYSGEKMREQFRQIIVATGVMKRIPKDIAWIFDIPAVDNALSEERELWDDNGTVDGGRNYGD